jgi:hypothetical protein
MNTIDTILKIAGAKNMKEFYSLYPSEEAFMEKHGKSFKKAMRGAKIKKADNGLSVLQKKSLEYLEPVEESPLKLESWMTDDANWPQKTKAPGMSLASGMQMGQKVIEGIQMLKEEKKQLQKAKQMKGVTDVMLQASQLPAERVEKNYVRPEDIRMTGEEMFPIYGTGTNVIAKKGAKIKKANNGSMVPWEMMGDRVSNMMTQITGEDGGGTIGGAVGETAGTLIGGPVGGAIGKVGGQLIGSLIDRKPERTKKYKRMAGTNIGKMATMQGMQDIFSQNNAYMKDGGNLQDKKLDPFGRFVYAVSGGPKKYDGINPWEMTVNQKNNFDLRDKFSNKLIQNEFNSRENNSNSAWNEYVTGSDRSKRKHFLMDSLANVPNLQESDYNSFNREQHVDSWATPDYWINKLNKRRNLDSNQEGMRDGGKLTNLEENGDLMMYDGSASPLSYNPHSAGTGETIMFNGPSHAEGGMDVSFGGNNVEVEGNEPAMHNVDGNGEENLVVFGNLVAPGYKGKKFKNIVKDIGEKENKEVKKLDKATDILNKGFDTPIDRLTFNSGMATQMGSNMKLKEYEQEKQDLSALQDAINSTAKDMGLVADALAKGKIQKDRSKKDTQTAQDGLNERRLRLEPWMVAKKFGSIEPGPSILNYSEIGEDNPVKHVDLEDITITAPRINKSQTPYIEDIQPLSPGYAAANADVELINAEVRANAMKEALKGVVDDKKEEQPKKGRGISWKDIASIMPYVRASDVEGLDPRQLMGEMMALTETEDPVQAQFFQPQLTPPYKVSFQDRMNDVVAQTRAAQRMAGDNPAAQALIAGQAYDSMNKVRAEEFRINQALESSTYEQNRRVVDEAKLRNLEIADTQAERQAMAKASTKEIKRKALESMSAKYIQNQLENRTLATYENLYNYRFDPNFRARNRNAPADFNIESSDIYTPEVLRAMAEAKERNAKKGTSSKEARNGSIVKAVKLI